MKLRNKLADDDNLNKRGEKRVKGKDLFPEIPSSIHQPTDKRSSSIV